MTLNKDFSTLKKKSFEQMRHKKRYFYCGAFERVQNNGYYLLQEVTTWVEWGNSPDCLG